MLKPLEYLYIVTAVVEIYAEATQNEVVRFFSKPLLMIVLLAFYWQSVGGNWTKLHKFLAASLVFSWFGDVALMFVPKAADDLAVLGLPKNPNFFLFYNLYMRLPWVTSGFIQANHRSPGPARACP